MDLSVLKWLDRTAAAFGEKTAFFDKEKGLTFSQLNHYAKAIGTYLSKKTAPDAPVVVMTGRHVLTPACYLGVVRAGCFYAPMDATMPTARLNQILGVIRAGTMLVDREHEKVARTLDFTGELLVMEDVLETEIDEALIEKRAAAITATTPLYVIFTSGSTGAPKGVITAHGSLMCYIDGICKVLDMNASDVLGNQSPLDYIAAVRDIYIPIKLGASTVILPKNEFSMPVQLFETLNAYKVTTLCWSVAGVTLPAKLGAFEAVKLETVGKVCFSGSVMPCKYLKIWQEHLPDVLYVNQYGPTEATASCTYYVVREKVEEDTVLPIGVPFENYRILLLNEDHTPTAPGGVGEICVGGPVLALGYYGNPEKTAEAFVQNPLNPNYRELIYKTGDLGKFREDGVLEFHGRKDRQIKHMGHRIELGEIEGTASQIPGVAECCALYHKEKELLYLFYAGETTSKEIALFFRKALPAFMVPRKIIPLPAIPKLPNGKMDMQTMKGYFQ